MNKSRIIIGDIHGYHNQLMALIAQLPKDVPITFVGDLIDRGRSSSKVVSFVKDGGYDCVLGNHEQMMVDELKYSKDFKGNDVPAISYYESCWLNNGGGITLDSYENDDGTFNIPLLNEHKEWMSKLPVVLEYKDVVNDKGDYLVVSHSTVADAWHLPHDDKQFKVRVIWDRKDMPRKIEGIYNAYGHTPQKNGPTVKGHFAAIDTGNYSSREGFGALTAIQFPEMIVYSQKQVLEEL